MNSPPDTPWTPDPLELAAYFDGELDNAEGLANLRHRIETWLERHPEALEEQQANQQLRKICLDTTPVEPSADIWNNTLQRIEKEASQERARKPEARRPWPAATFPRLGSTACAVGFILLAGLLFGALRLSQSNHPLAPPPEKTKQAQHSEDEVFAVATADEVVIFRVEGEDADSLVVGRLPLEGPIELAAAGEIRVFSLKPDEQVQMLPHPQEKSRSRPIIWAQLQKEHE